jgi:hypothetical protein
MTSTDWMPRKHEALYDKAGQTWLYISSPLNRDRMGFIIGTPSGVWLDTVFMTAYNTLETAFTSWKNPAERTPAITARLLEAEETFIPIYRMLYTGFLKSSPLVTDDDLVSMGLPKRHSGGNKPSPIARKNPDADIDTSQIRRVGVHFFEMDGAIKVPRPEGTHGVEAWWAVFDTRQEVTLDQLIHSSFSTRSPLTLDFPDEQRGKAVYFALRWENTRGEKGPFGPILFAIIP